MPNLEMLILGSGASSQLPVISCIVAKPGQGCACCLSTRLPSGVKNIRRNTSAILRVHPSPTELAPSRNQTSVEPKTILIDVGKSFCEAARQHFPPNNLSTIDAVLLTHPHADAINGLDDLRAWTLDSVIQSTIPIYCDQFTLSEVARMFPYMISTSKATGSGAVPAFEWHIIEDGSPFELFGVVVSPLKVQHGCYFDSTGSAQGPYGCLAFLFDHSLCYMADVSSVPESTYAALGAPTPSSPTLTPYSSRLPLGSTSFSISPFSEDSDEGSDMTTPPSSLASGPTATPPLPVLVIDTLRLEPHPSHFGIAQAISTAKRLGAQRTYLLGFSHGVTHECWERACEAIGEGRCARARTEESQMSEFQLGNDPEAFTQEALRLVGSSEPAWVRPAFDGLWIRTDGKKCTDAFY
ncbi:hypothetical protein CROQUDRAFT_86680 [Cronartium quercuum f. sp. fusiforme G11]|uniref:Metallo-beta-lactamase domain-containing protein n=1 Tax=Cronartium quercuum f. sp. fusiforme G11 TaxID=708437 RepID=A0A9P6NQQ9_9BASI|nr:hypothetical protein CROQUDRAFT_86680 [Cronartium quercuum f. sp. fusiforme G11]